MFLYFYKTLYSNNFWFYIFKVLLNPYYWIIQITHFKNIVCSKVYENGTFRKLFKYFEFRNCFIIFGCLKQELWIKEIKQKRKRKDRTKKKKQPTQIGPSPIAAAAGRSPNPLLPPPADKRGPRWRSPRQPDTDVRAHAEKRRDARAPLPRRARLKPPPLWLPRSLPPPPPKP